MMLQLPAADITICFFLFVQHSPAALLSDCMLALDAQQLTNHSPCKPGGCCHDLHGQQVVIKALQVE